jgi:hypothetical protein
MEYETYVMIVDGIGVSMFAALAFRTGRRPMPTTVRLNGPHGRPVEVERIEVEVR